MLLVSVFSKVLELISQPTSWSRHAMPSRDRKSLTKKAYLHGSGHSLEINGSLAICFGIAVIALAFFLHFHFVWSVSSRLYRYAGFCKFIALLVLISSFGYVLWRIIFFGIA